VFLVKVFRKFIGKSLKRKLKKSSGCSIQKCNLRRQIHLFSEKMITWKEILD